MKAHSSAHTHPLNRLGADGAILLSLSDPNFFDLAVVDVAVDPGVEFLDLGDVAALSAVLCVLRIF